MTTMNIIPFRPRPPARPPASVAAASHASPLTDLPVRVRFGAGERLPAIARVTGERELELRCNRETARALKPERGFLTTAQLPAVDLRVYLPLSPAGPPLSITCAVTRVAVTGPGDFMIALKMVMADPGTCELLDRFRVDPSNGFAEERSLQA